jgi:hypothetical protein
VGGLDDSTFIEWRLGADAANLDMPCLGFTNYAGGHKALGSGVLHRCHNDEIRFCLRSIHNLAPWIRAIWPVTDNQVSAAIDRRRAERDNIRIVDHREIFRGNEQLLPTFNSLAIETMLWLIDGLADCFLYFNDDMMFVGPVEPAVKTSHCRTVMDCEFCPKSMNGSRNMPSGFP